MFLGSFYLSFVLAKLAYVLAALYSRNWLRGKAYRMALAVIGVIFVLFGLKLGYDSLLMLN